MRNLLFLLIIAGGAYYGGTTNPGIGLFPEKTGSAELLGFGATACKYATITPSLKQESRTLLLTKTPNSEAEKSSDGCPIYVLLNDERLEN